MTQTLLHRSGVLGPCPGTGGGRGRPWAFPQRWGLSSAQAEDAAGGLSMSFCHNYLRGPCFLSAWSSFSSINVRFVLIQPRSPGGPSGTGSAHQSVSQMAYSLRAGTGHAEKECQGGPRGPASRGSNPRTVPSLEDRLEGNSKDSWQRRHCFHVWQDPQLRDINDCRNSPTPELGAASSDSGSAPWLTVANRALGNRTQAETRKVLQYGALFSLVAGPPPAIVQISSEQLPKEREFSPSHSS